MHMAFQTTLKLVPLLAPGSMAPDRLGASPLLRSVTPFTPYLTQPTRFPVMPLAMASNDMRGPNLPNLSPNDYPLGKVYTQPVQDEKPPRWAGGLMPNPPPRKKKPKPMPEEDPILDKISGGKSKTEIDTELPILEFNHDVAQQLIEDVNWSIQWLSTQKVSDSSEQKLLDAVQTKIIDVLDHYAGHYWLPLTLERLTPEDWTNIADAAGDNPAAAHFMSLIVTQICYSANSPDYFRLKYALEQMKKAGISIDPIATLQEDMDFSCAHPAQQSSEPTPDPNIIPPTTPVIGHVLRHSHPDPAKSFWIIGLAGIQTVTLGMNIQASAKAFLVDNRHWGYNEYYQTIVKPSLTQLLDKIEDCDHTETVPPTVHFSGHSMGGALAHFAALDFPPNKNTTDMQQQDETDKTRLVIHSNNGARAGNRHLEQEINKASIGCITSTHIQDIVNSVPPDFLGYSSRYATSPEYRNSLSEAAHKIRLLGKNWREGFVSHSLAVFIMMYVPEKVRGIFARHMLTLPPENNFEVLGYQVNSSNNKAGQEVNEPWEDQDNQAEVTAKVTKSVTKTDMENKDTIKKKAPTSASSYLDSLERED